MSARHRLLLSVFLLFGASACKSGGDPVQELCDLALSCSCNTPPYATAEACVADLNQDVADLKATAADNGLTFNQGCVDRTLAVYHDDIACKADLDVIGSLACEVCQPVHGDKPVGAVCSEFGDSKDFSDCASDLVCSNGKCIDPCARLAAGVACANTDGGAFEVLGTCADGLYCDYTVTKTCKARVPAGGECFGFDDCATGLVCGADNKCAKPPNEGEACTFACAGDLVCDAAVCVVAPGEGAACSMLGECAAELECSDTNVCVALEPLLCDFLTDK